MNTSESDWILLARAVRPQGRRGELLCDLHTDFPERFESRREVTLQLPDGTIRAMKIEEFWLPSGRSAGRVVLKFAGVDSIEAAKELIGGNVVLPASERVPPGPDEYYVDDLRGCALIDTADDDEHQVGTVTDVHFATDTAGRRLETAAPVLVVERANGDEVLVPLAKEFLAQADLANRRLVMRLPAGLVEANG